MEVQKKYKNVQLETGSLPNVIENKTFLKHILAKYAVKMLVRLFLCFFFLVNSCRRLTLQHSGASSAVGASGETCSQTNQ